MIKRLYEEKMVKKVLITAGVSPMALGGVMEAALRTDGSKSLRISHKNPQIIELYDGRFAEK